MVWLLDGEKTLRICLLISTDYTNVTDRPSDDQTDGRMDTSQQHRPHLRIASRGKTHTPAYCWMAIWHSFSSSSEMTNPESRGSDWWWTLPRQLRDDEGDDLLRTSVSPWDWPNPFTTVMIREDRLVQNLSLDAFSVSNQYKTLNRLHPYFVHPSVTPVTSALRHQYLAEPACKLKLKQIFFFSYACHLP